MKNKPEPLRNHYLTRKLALIDKNGGNWQDCDIGSIMSPQMYSEACECSWIIKEIELGLIMKDKNGVEIKVGCQVDVPTPNKTDAYYSEFRGTVADLFLNRGLVVVEDQDSDFYEIEPDRLEVVWFEL